MRRTCGMFRAGRALFHRREIPSTLNHDDLMEVPATKLVRRLVACPNSRLIASLRLADCPGQARRFRLHGGPKTAAQSISTQAHSKSVTYHPARMPARPPTKPVLTSTPMPALRLHV
jgi:hypothetical protein